MTAPGKHKHRGRKDYGYRKGKVKQNEQDGYGTGNDMQFWNNAMGNFNLRPGSGKWVAVGLGLLALAYECGDIIEFMQSTWQDVREWLNETPSFTAPSSPTPPP